MNRRSVLRYLCLAPFAMIPVSKPMTDSERLRWRRHPEAVANADDGYCCAQCAYRAELLKAANRVIESDWYQGVHDCNDARAVKARVENAFLGA
jgi:hypothetical protein